MLTYTKRNLSLISFILTIILFVLFHIIYSYFQKPEEKSLYYKKIPNYSLEILNNHISNNKIELLTENSLFNASSANLQENKIISKKLVEKNLTKTSTVEKNNSNKVNMKETNKNQENMQETNKNQGNTQESNNKTNLNEKTQTQIIQENKNKTWRIQIPKINLDVHISEGITSTVLLTSVGHFEQTSKWQGNVGLAAHNRGYKCNFFQNIKDLKIGDEIIYTTANGKKVYKVQTNKIISEKDWSYLQNTKDNRITLITCEEYRKDCRRCVQAMEIANYITN